MNCVPDVQVAVLVGAWGFLKKSFKLATTRHVVGESSGGSRKEPRSRKNAMGSGIQVSYSSPSKKKAPATPAPAPAPAPVAFSFAVIEDFIKVTCCAFCLPAKKA